ncbi:hypothetical protein Mal64_25580 [Pseudobythopirellula maris]|uniref:ABC transporter permease n=1 Tax=Pseudobythopirellula maris TaxID=2527991 RepID=A0A5C5ZPG6_9BACT|nr:ABC transporter permease [Pseudobythopirellula maris]TWT89066.1 hypothetical protein Mal64_25580 [Pseudobythopirellula maris]
MLAAVATIPLTKLALAFAPVALLLVVLWRWSLRPGAALYALGRMLVQLAAIGYVLAALFAADHPAWVLLALVVMTLAAGKIAIRTSLDRSAAHYWRAVAAIGLAGWATLAVVVLGVLSPQPWWSPRLVVPLAGMILANAMNAIGVAVERFESERERGAEWRDARNHAITAALIPATNALLAVGLVAIPGMMTGQVLSGEDPLVAARYQVMVMAMVYGSAGLACVAYFMLSRRERR